MAVLQKLRDKAGLAISILIAIGLLAFIIDPSSLETAMNSFSSQNDIGVVNGKKISYNDFQEGIQRLTNYFNFQGQNPQGEQAQKQLREMLWQEYIAKNVVVKNAKAAGICVGDQEMLQLTTGETPSPIIASCPVFMDESGNFSPDKVKEFVSNLDSYPETARSFWSQLQENIYNTRMQEKYTTMFLAGATLNTLEKENMLKSGNTTANVDFVMKPYSFTNDTTLNVTASEIKKYYNDNKKNYKCVASRDIEFVMFEVTPSEKDIEDAKKDFDEQYEEFKVTPNPKAFAISSDFSNNDYWYKKGSLASVSKEIDDFVFSGEGGTSPVFTEGNTWRAVRVIESAQMPDSVYVCHILLQGENAESTADSLLTEIKNGADFSLVASQFSEDKNSADNGKLGNIGWMTQDYIIPGMESVLTAETEKPYIINTAYGTHIVKVAKKTAPVTKKRVAIYEKTALASKSTYSQFYSKANEFATLAGGTLDGYLKAVDSLKTYSQPMNITEATSQYSFVDNAKEITRWAFDAKKGKSSDVITVNNNYYFIVAVRDINKEGFTPLEKVEPQIKQMLLSKAERAKMKEEFAAQVAGKDLAAIAEILGSEITSVEEMSLTGGFGSQNEPALIGAVSVAPEGKVCGPVSGEGGLYMLKVNSKTTNTAVTEEDVKSTATMKAQYSLQMLFPVMLEQADVTDNRERFF